MPEKSLLGNRQDEKTMILFRKPDEDRFGEMFLIIGSDPPIEYSKIHIPLFKIYPLRHLNWREHSYDNSKQMFDWNPSYLKCKDINKNPRPQTNNLHQLIQHNFSSHFPSFMNETAHEPWNLSKSIITFKIFVGKMFDIHVATYDQVQPQNNNLVADFIKFSCACF